MDMTYEDTGVLTFKDSVSPKVWQNREIDVAFLSLWSPKQSLCAEVF